VSDVQCDEIWGFVGCKEKHNRTGNPEFGDAYCFVAFGRASKIVLTWHLGRRTAQDTERFTEKLNEATAGKFQVTTDGFGPYFDAIHMSLGTRVDYAQLIKVYAAPSENEHRYSPASVIDAIAKPVWGQPDPARICTSHVERQNLTMRMQIRRLTRLTNRFSKKRANFWPALALYFSWYNFCRTHRTIRCTPAMEAGITDHVWTVEGLLDLEDKQMETYRNQNFEGKDFILEDVAFLKCKLADCDLYYSGGDFEWVETQFGNCRFHCRGAAKNTLALAQAIGMLKSQTLPPTVVPTSQRPN